MRICRTAGFQMLRIFESSEPCGCVSINPSGLDRPLPNDVFYLLQGHRNSLLKKTIRDILDGPGRAALLGFYQPPQRGGYQKPRRRPCIAGCTGNYRKCGEPIPLRRYPISRSLRTIGLASWTRLASYRWLLVEAQGSSVYAVMRQPPRAN